MLKKLKSPLLWWGTYSLAGAILGSEGNFVCVFVQQNNWPLQTITQVIDESTCMMDFQILHFGVSIIIRTLMSVLAQDTWLIMCIVYVTKNLTTAFVATEEKECIVNGVSFQENENMYSINESKKMDNCNEGQSQMTNSGKGDEKEEGEDWKNPKLWQRWKKWMKKSCIQV